MAQKPRATAKPVGPEVEALLGGSGPGQCLWEGGDQRYIIKAVDDTKVGGAGASSAGWPLCDWGVEFLGRCSNSGTTRGVPVQVP